MNFSQKYKNYLYIGLPVLVFLTLVAITLKKEQAVVPAPTNNEQIPEGFVFTAAADYGGNAQTEKVLREIRATAPAFHMMLGDLSYDEIKPETAWCNFVNLNLGSDVPIELLAGNHESMGEDGDIDNFTKCLPPGLSWATGVYPKQYYFDYPKDNPLARFIFISPGVTFKNKEKFSYSSGSENLKWLDFTIDSARAEGIPWIVVGSHKGCVTPGRKPCDMGISLARYLISKKVDLLVHGDDHVYGRSKPLKCISFDAVGPVFDPVCVAENKLQHVYEQGEGMVELVAGTGGRPLYAINESSDITKYFESYFGSGEDATNGFVKITITPDELRSDFIGIRGEKYRDSFLIKR
jgi:hypothetical protein